MEKSLWDKQTWPWTLSMRSGTWQSPAGCSAGALSWNSTAFPGIPQLSWNSPPPASRAAISEHTLSFWAESDCDFPLVLPIPTIPPQSFHTWFCSGFGISAGAAFPFFFLLKVSVVNFDTQLPNCGFWKIHKFPKETKILDWNRGEGVPCCGLLLLKYPAGSLEAAPAQMWGINNIFQKSLWTRKIQLAFALFPLFERPFPAKHPLLKFSISFVNAKQSLPASPFIRWFMRGAKALHRQEREKLSSTNIFANLTWTKQHFFFAKNEEKIRWKIELNLP